MLETNFTITQQQTCFVCKLLMPKEGHHYISKDHHYMSYHINLTIMLIKKSVAKISRLDPFVCNRVKTLGPTQTSD